MTGRERRGGGGDVFILTLRITPDITLGGRVKIKEMGICAHFFQERARRIDKLSFISDIDYRLLT